MNNEVAMTEVPSVMPAQLVHLRPRDFIRNILDPRRTHLSRFWSLGKIEDVERDHMKLVKDYEVKIELKQNVDAQDHTTMFNCAWDSMRGKYHALILSGDVIRDYHFSQVKIFHYEMGEKLKLKVADQPCARGHICDQVARSPDQNLSCICLLNTHYTWMPPLICLVCHF
jgi:hypothetical protein